MPPAAVASSQARALQASLAAVIPLCKGVQFDIGAHTAPMVSTHTAQVTFGVAQPALSTLAVLLCNNVLHTDVNGIEK